MRRVAAGIARRQGWTTAAALGLVALIAWAWLVRDVSQPMEMAMGWDSKRALSTLAMWFVMMVAMMLPAAAPTILLYDRAADRPDAPAPTALFLAGYLIAWLAFSIAATALQWQLATLGAIGEMTMRAGTDSLAGALLVAAGLYQWTPWKGACLDHCRNPARFIARHQRPGAAGAIRLGLIHGGYCVGCCGVLMTLLFVGGVMNLLWVAALTALVIAEKLLPKGQWLARASGAAMLAWGAFLLVR